jgi:hypothetical protein
MGGNALKHLDPVRLTSAEVIDFIHHLHRNWQLVEDRPLYPVPWVTEKADHGDIDVICEAPPETVTRFCGLIGADVTAISRNDAVMSVPVPLSWQQGQPNQQGVQMDDVSDSWSERARFSNVSQVAAYLWPGAGGFNGGGNGTFVVYDSDGKDCIMDHNWSPDVPENVFTVDAESGGRAEYSTNQRFWFGDKGLGVCNISWRLFNGTQQQLKTTP